MSSEQNKVLLQRLYNEVFNNGNLAVIDELIAPEAITHEESPVGNAGREAVRFLANTFHTAFRDFHVTPEDMIAEGDKVVARATFTGTHKGELMGIPPTGQAVRVNLIDFVRFANGQMVEHWAITDNMSLMEQLGVMPAEG